jgi:hypothetical protein
VKPLKLTFIITSIGKEVISLGYFGRHTSIYFEEKERLSFTQSIGSTSLPDIFVPALKI